MNDFLVRLPNFAYMGALRLRARHAFKIFSQAPGGLRECMGGTGGVGARLAKYIS